MATASRPTVTAEHQRDAFKAFAWKGWTFEQAMADPLRSRLVKLRARQLCSEQARLMRRTVVIMFSASDVSWLQGKDPRPLTRTDLKRAAAGDRDD